MKKFLFLLVLFLAIGAEAQIKLGLKLAPVIATNRAKNDNQTVENDGSKLKFSVGLIADKTLSETYFLSSGLVYLPKHIAFRAADGTEEAYTLQYIQIPATLKLFTNEIAPDLKAYLQVGSAIEIKVFDEPEDPNFVVVEKFSPLDVPVILGGGIEYRIGINTALFGGVSYQRGLINAVHQTVDGAADLQLRNTIFSIDLGVKF